jgi:DNA-binding transcriptional LysR family regulator
MSSRHRRANDIDAVPACSLAEGLGLVCFEPPMETPPPEVHMYWRRRHDANPAHRWLREKIVETLREVGVEDA